MTRQTITGLRYSKDNWFTCIDTVVLTDTELSVKARCVYAVLCAMAGFGNRSCEDTAMVAANLAGLSVQVVQQAYRELESRGVISRDAEGISLIGHNALCYGFNEEEER